MGTEDRNIRYRRMDEWSEDRVVRAYLHEHVAAARAAERAHKQISRGVSAIVTHIRAHPNWRVFGAGAGTSMRIVNKELIELVPTFGVAYDQVPCLKAGGDEALKRSVEGAEDNVDDAKRLVAEHNVGASDVFIGVAASGTTPFALTCVKEARERGALTVGVANNRGAPLLKATRHRIFLNSGREPIAGGTSSMAGTAQMVALNTLLRSVMIKLGGVYEGYMVGLGSMRCEKLDKRRVRVVRDICSCDQGTAEAALNLSGGNIKLAVLILDGNSLEGARTLLKLAEGNLRDARTIDVVERSTR